jgi:hypothetical protein
MQSVIARAHRNKSQELLEKLHKDDPSDVAKEIRDIKGLITDKIKHLKEKSELNDQSKQTDLHLPDETMVCLKKSCFSIKVPNVSKFNSRKPNPTAWVW